MKNALYKIIIVSIIMTILFSSCVSSTRVNFNTDVDGAMLSIDGEQIGKTPVQVKLSNAVWEDPDITIKKDGYKTLRTDVNKELKAVNLIFGLILWWPSLLYSFGPKANQNYELILDSE